MEKLGFHDVGFAYPGQTARVFSHLNLRIEEGEFLAVLGPSGCGKSTLLHLLAGLALPRSGQVCLDGAAVTGPGRDRGLVFQEYSLFPWLTAGGNVAFCARLADKTLTRRQARTLALDYLSQVGLAEQADAYPSALSGGMRQRVAIAKTLALSPSVLLFDEPFGALDPQSRSRLQGLLGRIWGAQTPRKTVVFVTHDIDEALLLADRVVYLGGGQVEDEFVLPFSRPRAREQLLTPQACALRKRCMQRFQESEAKSFD